MSGGVGLAGRDGRDGWAATVTAAGSMGFVEQAARRAHLRGFAVAIASLCLLLLAAGRAAAQDVRHAGAASQSAAGQAGASSAPQGGSPVPLPAAPTTKVLAIGHLTAAAMAPGAMKPVMPSEVRATVQLYLGGKIDQWYVRQDKPGVVFLMNVATVAEAHALLETLPLGVRGLMEFDLIPLGPLTPLSMLVKEPAAQPVEAK